MGVSVQGEDCTQARGASEELEEERRIGISKHLVISVWFFWGEGDLK